MVAIFELWLAATAGHEAICALIGSCHNGWAEGGGTFTARNQEVAKRRKKKTAYIIGSSSRLMCCRAQTMEVEV